jgi:hypothetical protein
MDATGGGGPDQMAVSIIDHDAQVDQWDTLSPLERSAWVIAWCDVYDVPCPFLPTQLTRAMALWPSCLQGPSNYLDMVNAGIALLIPVQEQRRASPKP